MKDTFEHIDRPSVPAMNAIINDPTPVLDHGFVRCIDYMGDDQAIVQAARVSYGRGTKTPSNDRGLIRYLMRHWHTTPFEMASIKLHVKLPVFVARQWIRHRTASVNEYSARYSVLDREFYIPDQAQIAKQSTTNKQGRGDGLDDMAADDVRIILRHDADNAYDSYEELLDEDGPYGLSRELARMNLPTNIYTQWYWKVDLHNLFHFLRLRADPHAQWEIRQYAGAICDIVAEWVPYAYEAFVDYRLEAEQFSFMEMKALHTLLGSTPWSDEDQQQWVADNAEHFGLSKREATDFIAKIKGEQT